MAEKEDDLAKADPNVSPPSHLPSSPGVGATSASSRLWSSWTSPSTTASTAASSALEERRKKKRPTFEEFRAQEPPQARLIRLRGLFDVLLDKDAEQALAGGRAKEEWTQSAMRARYGAGGIYARGSMAPKSTAQTSAAEAAFEPISESSSGSTRSTPSPPRQSYAKELLSQCRHYRAQLEKERLEMEKKHKKLSSGHVSESSSWTSWIPFLGDDEEGTSTDTLSSSSTLSSIKDKISELSSSKDTTAASNSSTDTNAPSSSSSSSSLTSIPSKFTSLLSNKSDDTNPSASIAGVAAGTSAASTSNDVETANSTQLHSDHEGEAGWIGSGVWGLSAVGHKQRKAFRELDARLAAGQQDEGGKRQRQIEWEGFLRYADQKERELYRIFSELDKNGDMRLDVAEINTALDRAGIELSRGALEDFIASLGSSSRFQGSGCPSSISFPQFRDYLLLLPRSPSVHEIFRFYQVRKAFGLFGSQGIFAEFSDRWGRSERHGATSVTQDGDVSLAGEERKKLGDDEKEAKREARRVIKEEAVTRQQTEESSSLSSATENRTDSARSNRSVPSNQIETSKQTEESHEEEDDDPDMIHGDVAIKFLLAGGIAGAVSRTATAPFDRLKIYLITTARTTAIREVASSTVSSTDAASRLASSGFGVLGEAIRALYREGGGLKAFWVGNGLNCLKIFPESAIKFLSYETSKRAFAKYVDGVSDSRDISGSSRFLSGGIGGITSQLAIYPVETLKTRLMSSQGGATHGNALLKATASDMWRSGGFKTYYRGLTAGLIGVFPYSAIDMSTFEGIKLFYIKYTGREEPGVLALLAFGSISGSVGATTVYPLNLVRTRLQAAGTPAHPQTYDGFFDVARKTFRNEGVVGFYRGLVPSLAKVVPAVSISYVVYEHSKRRLGVQ